MKPILFIDFDGTLCFDRFWRNLKPEELKKVQHFLFTSNKEILRKWMLGEFTSEEVNLLVSESLSLDYTYLLDTFIKDCETMDVSKTTLKRVHSLRDTYTTILITDNMDCFSRFTVPSLNLQNYFDEIINSSDRRLSKNENDGQLFIDVTREHNSDLKKSMLLDNSLDTCTIFENLGGKSLFVTPEKPLSYWLETLR